MSDIPDPWFGIDPDLLRKKAGLQPGDVTQDAAIQAVLAVAIDLLETYLDRWLRLNDYTETFVHISRDTISLKAYPLSGIIAVITADGHEPEFHPEKATGLIHLDGRVIAHELQVQYRGGYEEFPAAILLAILQLFDVVWAAQSGAVAAVGGGAVRSISSAGATISYFDPAAGGSSAGIDVESGLPSSVVALVSAYRRKYC